MPAYKTPKHFPGVDKLPPLAQALIERVFPPDELPVPAISASIGGPLRAKARGRSLIEDIRTLPTMSGWDPNMVSALTRAQQQYPRLFGAIDEITPAAPPGRAGQMRPISWHSRMSELGLDQGPIAKLTDMWDTVGHEMTHVAQNLRKGPRWLAKANEYGKYADRPIEVSARKSGQKFSKQVR